MMRRDAFGLSVVVAFLAADTKPVDSKPVDIKNLSCETFLAEPDDVRPMLVAWVHGYTHAGGGNWVVDAATARAFVTSVEDKCKAAPKASFRYQVLETAKQRQAAAKSATKK